MILLEVFRAVQFFVCIECGVLCHNRLSILSKIMKSLWIVVLALLNKPRFRCVIASWLHVLIDLLCCPLIRSLFFVPSADIAFDQRFVLANYFNCLYAWTRDLSQDWQTPKVFLRATGSLGFYRRALNNSSGPHFWATSRSDSIMNLLKGITLLIRIIALLKIIGCAT